MLQFLVAEVNKLLNTNYNMISFDSLSNNDLLQVCAECLMKTGILDPSAADTSFECLVTKTVDILINIRIPIILNMNINEYTDGIINGKRSVIHATLNWILKNLDEVTKRAYFSKYLKKITVSPALAADPDIQNLFVHYESVLQDFRIVHSENTKYSKTGQLTKEFRKEIESILNIRSNIIDQIEKQKTKVDNMTNKESLLTSVKAFRYEIHQQKNLQAQIDDQHTVIDALELQIKKSNATLRHKQTTRIDDSFLPKLRDEVQSNRIITKERLPFEYEFAKAQSELIEMVATEPQPTQKELTNLQHEVDNIVFEIQTLVEKSLSINNPEDNKLNQFRQLASVTANNKQLAAESMMEVRDTATIIRRKVTEKENELQNIIGGVMPQGDDLKLFVSKLRVRNNTYKENRTQLMEIQAEIGILSRTLEILQEQNFLLAETLKNQQNSINDQIEIVYDDKEFLIKSCKDLAVEISYINSEVIRQRQLLQKSKMENEGQFKNYEQAKEIYNSSMTNFLNETDRLQLEIQKIDSNTKKAEENWKLLKKEIERKEEIWEKLSGDVEFEDRQEMNETNVFKETFLEQINEEDHIKKQMEKEKRIMLLEKEKCEQQMHFWYSLSKILKCKKMITV